MASRLSLGRIIEWARNADVEEVAYVTSRLGKLLQERVTGASAPDGSVVKRPRKVRGKKQTAPNGADVQMGEDAAAAQGVHG